MLVLVTGSTGFVGQHLCSALQKIKIPFLAPKRDELDLLNFENTLSYLRLHKPTFIFHLAGCIGNLKENTHFPARFYFLNTCITNNLLRAATEIHCDSFINLSSACVYPDRTEILHESNLMRGLLDKSRESYALSKLDGIKACEFIEQEYGFQYKSVIACNLYGPKDHFHPQRSHFVPAIIYKTYQAIAEKSETITIWGDGSARREVLYISDLVDYLLLCMEKINSIPSITNVGFGSDLSMNDYYAKIAATMGYTGIFAHDLSSPSGIKKRLLNSTIANQLGWIPKISFEEGITETITWFLKNRSTRIF